MSLNVLTSEAARAFRDAEDGLTLVELGTRIGTRWPSSVFRALVREGFVFGEQHSRLFLAREPDVERITKSPSSCGDVPPLGGSLSVASTSRLFDVPGVPSAYRVGA